MPTYVVTGASGFIAAHLIKRLVADGHKVIGTVRDMSSNENAAKLGAKLVEVQLHDTASLAKAFKGADGVFHMAAVHPEYGFAETPEGREGMLKTAVDGTTSVLAATKKAGVKRLVLTSSLAAVECGNDEGTLTESTWSRPEVYDSAKKLNRTQWATHYTYVKSKVEQEKAAVAEATKLGLDMRVVVPGNLVVGPIESKKINGTMTRLRDIMSGTNTLKGAADLAVVHVADVVDAHAKCMYSDGASGRYLVAQDMVKIEDVFSTLNELYPKHKVANLENQDIASGVPGKARKIGSRVGSLGVELKDFKTALKDAVDSMIANNIVESASKRRRVAA